MGLTVHSTPTDDAGLAAEALAQGQRLLAQGQAEAAAAALMQARQHPATRLAAHNLLEQHRLPGAFGEWMGVHCEISPQDDIYKFFDGHPTSTNPLRDYLADGWRTLSELMLLLEQVDRPLLRVGSFLEFASGHGRFTRHLVKALGAQRVTASDVVPDAVAFAQERLGVRAFQSVARPEDLPVTQRHEVVFVLSLFSHLPRASWGRWLTRLGQLVAPGGLLVFSTHGAEAARRQQVRMDAEGFFFAPSSESNAIDAQEYGTTFTSEVFVRARLAECLPGAELLHFAPVWFWRHQDAWVVRLPAGGGG
ncbi:MAG: class I SAM-dependent methyltransferase [Comamonadaceae bacterium]|nr:class I SAM-dependent methyltransferase [Comamonadaceae bacterium]